MEEAARKCRNAGIAALINACITVGVFAYTLYFGAEGTVLEYLNDPWVLLDAGLFVILAIGVFAKSRSAAVSLLVFYIVGQVILRLETGSYRGLLLTIVFIYFYSQGVMGAFAYTRERREVEPNYRRKPFWLLALLALGVLSVAALIGYSVWLERSGLASILEREQVPQKHIEWMQENGLLKKGEYVDLFYSSSMVSLREDGNMLTSRAVVSYWVFEGETYYERLNYDEVDQLNMLAQGSFAEFTILEVVGGVEGSANSEEQVVFELYLPGEKDEDLKFISLMEERTGLKVQSVAAEPALEENFPSSGDEIPNTN